MADWLQERSFKKALTIGTAGSLPMFLQIANITIRFDLQSLWNTCLLEARTITHREPW